MDPRGASSRGTPTCRRRLTTLTSIGNADLWGYLAGEYGGGSWQIKRASGQLDQFDYNDLRAMAGLEWIGYRGYRGYFEAGYVFDREVIFRSNHPYRIVPNDTL